MPQPSAKWSSGPAGGGAGIVPVQRNGPPDSVCLADPLCRLLPGLASRNLLIIVAHPDDEVIGAGGHLARWRGLRIVSATSGAPVNSADARELGFSTREQYARARRDEFLKAMTLAGIRHEHAEILHFGDQETAFHLMELAFAVAKLIDKIRPAAILTHPYEGGHPDHDSTAFGVHFGCRLARARPPAILEMTSYHNCGGAMRNGEFLATRGDETVTVRLNRSALETKQRLLELYGTQSKVLRWFRVDQEAFRRAPHYNFAAAPHPGELYYEKFNWGIQGGLWRTLASRAAGQIRRSPHADAIPG